MNTCFVGRGATCYDLRSESGRRERRHRELRLPLSRKVFMSSIPGYVHVAAWRLQVRIAAAV